MVPNIFQYATKELSQDAFICWLVACAREADGELGKCGIAFVEALMRAGGARVIDAQSGAMENYDGEGRVNSVCDPSPQHGGIDVYFQAKIDGNVVSFVLEDKTGTEMHGGQLERYRKAVRKDTEEEDLIKAVYFKTGYVFDDERERAESAGYCVFDAEDVVAFFKKDEWRTLHDFVDDFAERIGKRVKARQKALSEWDLNEGFVQWEFMAALRNALGPRDEQWPARYFNVGGAAWTQYPHYEQRGDVFWRLDSWKPLRLMVDTKSVGGERALGEWDGWDRAFRDATQRCGLESAPFRRVRQKNGKVVKEGTIGAVNVQSCLERERLDGCMQRVVELHRRFVGDTGLSIR